MDCPVKSGSISERLMRKVKRLEVVPDDLDVGELGRIFW